MEFEQEYEKTQNPSRGGLPPPGSIVVMISDPPPARGQPARQHRMEDTFRCKTQLQIYPSNRVNLHHSSSDTSVGYPLRSALLIPPGYQVSHKVPNTL